MGMVERGREVGMYERLNNHQRESIFLLLKEGVGQSVIAQVVGTSSSTVHSLKIYMWGREGGSGRQIFAEELSKALDNDMRAKGRDVPISVESTKRRRHGKSHNPVLYKT